MVQTFLLFDHITNEKTVKFMKSDIITSTITWHLGLVGSNNFSEYTSFSPFTLNTIATIYIFWVSNITYINFDITYYLADTLKNFFWSN